MPTGGDWAVFWANEKRKRADLIEKRKKADLIEKALYKFGFHHCPHCERELDLSLYLNRSDIEKWLEDNDG